MNKDKPDTIQERQSAIYSGSTLTNGSSVRGSYTVKDGTTAVGTLAFRKCSQLSAVVLNEGLLKIGDAAFSHCVALKRVTIPKSVEEIGVAAFCKSGLEEVTFEGVPKVIGKNAFYGCAKLKRIIVPKGQKQLFEELFGNERGFEIVEATETDKPTASAEPKVTEVDLFGIPVVRKTYLSYNQREFCWRIDDEVKLSELFSSPVTLEGDVSYQFRKKALFVFIKSKTASRTNLLGSREYALTGDGVWFKQKFADKYSISAEFVRIFIMVCDDNENARFYDEVRLKKVMGNNVIVKSVVRNFR